MGEEEVATKKGRRMIACSGRFHQKLLEPFLIAYEHADQYTLSEAREAFDWQGVNIKLLVIWAWFMCAVLITVKIVS